MANLKKKEYKPKKANEIKLMLFLKKIEKDARDKYIRK